MNNYLNLYWIRVSCSKMTLNSIVIFVERSIVYYSYSKINCFIINYKNCKDWLKCTRFIARKIFTKMKTVYDGYKLKFMLPVTMAVYLVWLNGSCDLLPNTLCPLSVYQPLAFHILIFSRSTETILDWNFLYKVMMMCCYFCAARNYKSFWLVNI